MPIYSVCSAIPFVAIRAPKGVFLWALQRHGFCNRFSSYSYQICIGPCSRCQSIFGTLQFHLWPLGCQISFFLVYYVNPRIFQQIFFTPQIPQTKAQMPSNFQHSAIPFFGHQGAKFIFLVCALQPLVFIQFFQNLYHLFIGPCFRPQYIFVIFVATRGPNAYFLVCAQQHLVLIFQIHTKSLLNYVKDPSTFSPTNY